VAKITHFVTHCKIRRGMGEMSLGKIQVFSVTELGYTCDGASAQSGGAKVQ